jgi:hypothetical protein
LHDKDLLYYESMIKCKKQETLYNGKYLPVPSLCLSEAVQGLSKYATKVS